MHVARFNESDVTGKAKLVYTGENHTKAKKNY